MDRQIQKDKLKEKQRFGKRETERAKYIKRKRSMDKERNREND